MCNNHSSNETKKCKCGNGDNCCSKKKDFVVNFEVPLVVQNFAPDKALSIKAGTQLIRIWEASDKSVYIEVNEHLIKLGE